MRRQLSLLVTFAVLCISAGDATAGGLFRKHYVTYQVPPCLNGSCGDTNNTNININSWQFVVTGSGVGTMQIVPIIDFGVASKDAGAQQIPNDRFAIRIPGDSPCIATLAGEKVVFAAKCTVQIPEKYRQCLVKTGCPFIMLEPFNVVLRGTFDQEGVARFNRSEVLSAMGAELRRLRFFDHPSLFGIERIGIRIEGCARTGSFLFKSTNSLVLLGNVDESQFSNSQAAANGVTAVPPVAQ